MLKCIWLIKCSLHHYFTHWISIYSRKSRGPSIEMQWMTTGKISFVIRRKAMHFEQAKPANSDSIYFQNLYTMGRWEWGLSEVWNCATYLFPRKLRMQMNNEENDHHDIIECRSLSFGVSNIKQNYLISVLLFKKDKGRRERERIK